jgi:membrane-bound serine protease (ClpP class)
VSSPFFSLHATLSHLTPNAAILLLTLGLAFIYYEFNRPGSILPGALGLLTTLLAIAALAPYGFAPVGILLTFTASALLTLGLLRPTSILFSSAATLALICGFYNLLAHPGSHPVSASVAIGCGLLLGIGTSALTRIARRARVNKGLD